MPFKTFTLQKEPGVRLKPVMPDRPMCTRLDRSLHIPGGEDILLFISSPIRIQVETHKPRFLMEEISSASLSDTWWGSNTQEGKLCYAGDVSCSTKLEELPHGTDRIISPLWIKNRSKKMLTFCKHSML